MGARPERKQAGWSFGEEGHEHLPRHELPAEHLHSLEIAADPATAAWDEPGYVDPDWHHAHLPDGSPYWQGYAKKTPGRKAPRSGEERPLSPEFVTRITRRHYPDSAALTEEAEVDPHWYRRQRTKERDLFSRLRMRIWPG
jgi:hypothetical protein